MRCIEIAVRSTNANCFVHIGKRNLQAGIILIVAFFVCVFLSEASNSSNDEDEEDDDGFPLEGEVHLSFVAYENKAPLFDSKEFAFARDDTGYDVIKRLRELRPDYAAGLLYVRVPPDEMPLGNVLRIDTIIGELIPGSRHNVSVIVGTLLYGRCFA